MVDLLVSVDTKFLLFKLFNMIDFILSLFSIVMKLLSTVVVVVLDEKL